MSEQNIIYSIDDLIQKEKYNRYSVIIEFEKLINLIQFEDYKITNSRKILELLTDLNEELTKQRSQYLFNKLNN